jgi:hypothetical protein
MARTTCWITCRSPCTISRAPPPSATRSAGLSLCLPPRRHDRIRRAKQRGCDRSIPRSSWITIPRAEARHWLRANTGAVDEAALRPGNLGPHTRSRRSRRTSRARARRPPAAPPPDRARAPPSRARSSASCGSVCSRAGLRYAEEPAIAAIVVKRCGPVRKFQDDHRKRALRTRARAAGLPKNPIRSRDDYRATSGSSPPGLAYIAYCSRRQRSLCHTRASPDCARRRLRKHRFAAVVGADRAP